MEKLIRYIRTDKGHGLMFLLAAAVLMTIFVMFLIKSAINEVEPLAMTAAKDILPITTQNGRITDPLGVYKRVDLKFSEEDDFVFPVVLDTREEKSQISDKDNGIYIMRDMVYVVTPKKIEKITLTDGTYDVEAFQRFVNYLVGGLSLFMSLLMVVIFFVVLLLKTLMVSFVGRIVYRLQEKKEQPFAIFMRLSALIVVFVEVLCSVCSFYLTFLRLSGFQLLIIEMVLVGLLLSRKKILI